MSARKSPVQREELAETLWQSDDLDPGFTLKEQQDFVQVEYLEYADAILGAYTVLPRAPVAVSP